jgi:hypothetical protein
MASHTKFGIKLCEGVNFLWMVTFFYFLQISFKLTFTKKYKLKYKQSSVDKKFQKHLITKTWKAEAAKAITSLSDL